ncbi:hypothetical protein [Nitratireductor sp. GCM10026969]|uniref:hypothetical protein n=1 Tax=Nitratireductor sp. GCM10026969 TaxID=3252645 RepID=UPI00362400C5
MSLAFLTGLLACPLARADDQYIINQKQTGVSLPGVVMPHGFDEIRAADGTTCRSSMSGSGAYVDSGVIGGGLDGSSSQTLSAYGRVVVPLGRKPKRLDCDRLYQLELERLRLEVQLLKHGLDPRTNSAVSNEADWAGDDGWTTGDRR